MSFLTSFWPLTRRPRRSLRHNEASDVAGFATSKSWISKSEEILKIVRALEPIVEFSIASLPDMTRSCSVSHESYWLHDQHDLAEAVGRLPGQVDYIVVRHTGQSRPIPGGRPSLATFSLTLYKGRLRTDITLEVSGPDAPEYHGLVQTTINRLNIEFDRQEAANWDAVPPEYLVSVESDASATPTPAPQTDHPNLTKEASSPSKQAKRSLLGRFLSNGWTIGIGATVIGGLILYALIGGQGQGPTTPTPSTPASTSQPSEISPVPTPSG
jgi:hypothetical protein